MGTPVRSGFVSPLMTYEQANDALLSESQKVLWSVNLIFELRRMRISRAARDMRIRRTGFQVNEGLAADLPHLRSGEANPPGTTSVQELTQQRGQT